MSEAPPEEPRDFHPGWYGAAMIIYIVGGFLWQSVLLNWLVGPLFLLAILYVFPTVGRIIVARLRAAK